MTAGVRELQSRSLRREVNERIAELIEGFHTEAEEPVMTVFCECGSDECMAPIEVTLAESGRPRGADALGDLQRPHRHDGGLDHRASERLRTDWARFQSAVSRGSISEEGADIDITSDDKLVRTLILLLAACERATQELKQTEVELDGLGGDLESLSSRLHELLGRDPRKTPTT
jgi:hypothetical protein